MVEPSNQSSLGARFRAAGWEEKPLQVAGAINTYTARLAEATVFRSRQGPGAMTIRFLAEA
jgi:methylisocitrate lyase